MKRVVFTLVFFMAFFYVDAQNLVPNFSFEDTIKCPNAYFYFQGYVRNWGGIEPGYFTPFCNDGGLGGMPVNTFGYQYPHTGNAYVGMYTYSDAGKDTTSAGYKANHNVRDYVQDSLTSSLIAGKKYYLTFYVSLGDSFKYACNNIGACFSDSSLKFSRHVLSYHIPQVMNDTAHHLTDKINWMKVSGSFVAKGGEQYIIIGNFKDDAHIDTLNTDTVGYPVHQWACAYYFLDDVIVTTDSNYADSLFPTSVQSISKPKEVVNVYPNPSNGLFNLEIRNNKLGINNTIEVYNMLWQNIYRGNLNPNTTEINISTQAAGLYLYRVVSEKGEYISSGKLVIE
jgi:hypothetical protein